MWMRLSRGVKSPPVPLRNSPEIPGLFSRSGFGEVTGDTVNAVASPFATWVNPLHGFGRVLRDDQRVSRIDTCKPALSRTPDRQDGYCAKERAHTGDRV